MTPRKFRNEPIVVDGIRFDSKGEAARWHFLRLRERAGEITNLERQVKFKCVISGVKICTYIADFAYFADGCRVVEDFKSPATAKLPMFRLKKKLVEALFPGVSISVVSKGKTA